MGMIRSGLSAISKPFRWFGKGHVDAVKRGVALPEHRVAGRLTRSSLQRIKKHFRDQHANRDPNVPGAPDMTNFDEVLDHWEITWVELPLVIRGIKLQIAAFSVLGLLSCLGLYWGFKTVSWLPIVNAAMVFVMSSTVVVGRYWRLQVLRCERFFSFKDWITGRVH